MLKPYITQQMLTELFGDKAAAIAKNTSSRSRTARSSLSPNSTHNAS